MKRVNQTSIIPKIKQPSCIFMKVVLLAGGFGSRISEESQFKPKLMMEIGGMQIL